MWTLNNIISIPVVKCSTSCFRVIFLCSSSDAHSLASGKFHWKIVPKSLATITRIFLHSAVSLSGVLATEGRVSCYRRMTHRNYVAGTYIASEHNWWNLAQWRNYELGLREQSRISRKSPQVLLHFKRDFLRLTSFICATCAASAVSFSRFIISKWTEQSSSSLLSPSRSGECRF